MTKKLVEYKALTNFITNNTCFEISKSRLFCKVCEIEKDCQPKEGITPLKKHMLSGSHISKECLKKRQRD